MSNENFPPTPPGAEDDVPRNAKGQPLWPRPPRKPLTGWVLLLPIALLLGAVLFKINADHEGTTNAVDNNTVSPSVAHTIPRHNVDNTKSQPNSTTQEANQVVLYVPNDQAELTRQPISLDKLGVGKLEGGLEKNFETVGKAALNRIFTKYPAYFPAGTRVESLKKTGNEVTLDLPADFATSPLWEKGDSFGLVASNSIVNTLAAVAGDGTLAPIKVRFLSGGKSFEVLGQIDMTDPLEPNPTPVSSP